MKLLIILGIYILGFILSYYTGRAIWKRKFSQWGWDDIFSIMKLSLFSWITFIVLILLDGNLLFPPIKRKPPKWLILIPLLTLTACTDSGEIERMGNKQDTCAKQIVRSGYCQDSSVVVIASNLTAGASYWGLRQRSDLKSDNKIYADCYKEMVKKYERCIDIIHELDVNGKYTDTSYGSDSCLYLTYINIYKSPTNQPR